MRQAIVGLLLFDTACLALSADRGTSTQAALAEDDACKPGLARGDGPTCALGALQVAQRKSGIELPRTTAAPANYGGEWALSEGQLQDVWKVNLSTDYIRGLAKAVTHMPYCKEWTVYYWPQISFWSGEIGRRLRMVSADDEEGLRRARVFAHQAGYLSSIMRMDPRGGHSWSKPSQSFFAQVAESDSLDMPELPAFFRQSSNLDLMVVIPSTISWFQTLACEADWWRQDMLQGGKDDHTCWSKVERPRYGISMTGFSIAKDEPTWPLDYDYLAHPEYLECQAYDLNESFLSSFCPIGGHIQDGVMGQTWGKGVPTRGRDEVAKCMAKMGPAEYISVDSWFSPKSYTSSDIGLGSMVIDGLPHLPSIRGLINSAVNEDHRRKLMDTLVSADTAAKSHTGVGISGHAA